MEMKFILENEEEDLFIKGVSLVHISRNIKEKIEPIASIVKSTGAKDLVLMDHFESTTNLARDLQNMKTELNILGGVVLNENVGGLNVSLVESELSLGASIIWMPTISVENTTKAAQSNSSTVSLTTNKGTVLPAVYDILDLIAQKEASLGTGYLCPDEVEKLIVLAKARGVKKFIVTCSDECEHSLPLGKYEGISFEKSLDLCVEKTHTKKLNQADCDESASWETRFFKKIEKIKFYLQSLHEEEIVFNNIEQPVEYSLSGIVNS